MGQSDKRAAFAGLNENKIDALLSVSETPFYVIDKEIIRRNCEVLYKVAKNTGCKVLLAQKAFSGFDLYPLMSEYLDGTEASGLYEAMLGREEMPGKEVHVFSAAYRERDFTEITKCCDHIVFNSPAQLKKYGKTAKAAGCQIGLRINPECSVQDGGIYDPCSEGSRLGTTRENFNKLGCAEKEMLDGIHFHTLCEQNSDALEKTLEAVELKFGDILGNMQWVNFGGGHHITRPDYDVEKLEKCITDFSEKYGVTVYLEPGEACALNAGYLVTEVLDIVGSSGKTTLITDVSPACHMPDVLEMPYNPPIFGVTGDGCIKYRLGGPTCLAGDVTGEYTFREEVKTGDRLILGDMAIYSFCKNNTFNGMPLPDIYVIDEDGSLDRLTRFGYADFKARLGKISK